MALSFDAEGDPAALLRMTLVAQRDILKHDSRALKTTFGLFNSERPLGTLLAVQRRLAYDARCCAFSAPSLLPFVLDAQSPS